MPKTTLEQAIQVAANQFALQVVDLVKGASLQELLNLQKGGGKRAGRKPKASAEAPAKAKRTKKVAKKRVAKKKRATQKRAAQKK